MGSCIPENDCAARDWTFKLDSFPVIAQLYCFFALIISMLVAGDKALKTINNIIHITKVHLAPEHHLPLFWSLK